VRGTFWRRPFTTIRPSTRSHGQRGVSRFVLVRYFRRELGTTPHAWLLQLRVERARGMAATAVAADTGFADQAHFSRVFKRIVGLTPRAYAQRRGR
jgi:AraC-like DNA-binding protein